MEALPPKPGMRLLHRRRVACMDPEHLQRVKQILEQARDLPRADLKAFLDRACSGNEALRREVESQLAGSLKAEGFRNRRLGDSGASAEQPLNAAGSDLTLGTRLASYVIETLEGRGGMGVVYRARDEKLHRQVAIKILAPGTLQDDESRRRFLTEARALAKVNHPNILTIYDVSRSDGIDFIAMEWVEGARLDKLIADKGVSLDDMLGLAIQIALALSLAHAQGIIHRDLKPTNVMVTTAGLVKVLDFGLAKVTHGKGQDVSTESSAAAGRIVGTVAYMSPEQAQAKPVDCRSDIFSFGSVLYEMICRRPAFGGDSAISTIAAIIKEEPPLLNDRVPADLRTLVGRCLRKDPERRFQAIADVRVQLEEIRQERVAPRTPAPSPSLIQRVRSLAPAGLLLACALIAAVILRWLWPAQIPDFEVIPITSGAAWEGKPQISPDCSRIAFTSDASGKMDIYVADVSGRGRRRLTTSPGNHTDPAWFPNGTAVAFTSNRRGKSDIWKVGTEDGGETLLVEDAVEPSISPGGTEILFERVLRDGYRIAVAPLADVSKVTLLADLLSEPGSPAWSPDGRKICYLDQQDLWIIDAPGGRPQRITTDAKHKTAPSWSRDGQRIYYSSLLGGSEAIWCVSSSGGAAKRITDGMSGETHPTLSRDGKLLVCANDTSKRSIVLLNRESGLQETLPGRDCYTPNISPDGTRVIFTSTLYGSDNNLWSQTLNNGVPAGLAVRLTEGEGLLSHPDLSPDGKWITCYRIKGNAREIMLFPSQGGKPRQMTTDPPQSFTPSWSPDGSMLSFATVTSTTSEIVTATVRDGLLVGTPRKVVSGLAAYGPVWSPDARTLVFVDGINDATEVWAAPADGSAAARQITKGAGAKWVWWDPRTADLLVSGTWGEQKVALRRVSVTTGRPSPAAPEVDFGGARSQGLFHVSANGRWLVYIKEEIVGHIWMLRATRGTF